MKYWKNRKEKVEFYLAKSISSFPGVKQLSFSNVSAREQYINYKRAKDKSDTHYAPSTARAVST